MHCLDADYCNLSASLRHQVIHHRTGNGLWSSVRKKAAWAVVAPSREKRRDPEMRTAKLSPFTWTGCRLSLIIEARDFRV